MLSISIRVKREDVMGGGFEKGGVAVQSWTWVYICERGKSCKER